LTLGRLDLGTVKSSFESVEIAPEPLRALVAAMASLNELAQSETSETLETIVAAVTSN
jgi:hypothetical protein